MSTTDPSLLTDSELNAQLRALATMLAISNEGAQNHYGPVHIKYVLEAFTNNIRFMMLNGTDVKDFN